MARPHGQHCKHAKSGRAAAVVVDMAAAVMAAAVAIAISPLWINWRGSGEPNPAFLFPVSFSLPISPP